MTLADPVYSRLAALRFCAVARRRDCYNAASSTSSGDARNSNPASRQRIRSRTLSDPDELITIYKAANSTEAYFIKNLLMDAGIEASGRRGDTILCRCQRCRPPKC